MATGYLPVRDLKLGVDMMHKHSDIWTALGGVLHDKGTYPDYNALHIAWPIAQDGDYATVLETDTRWIWDTGTVDWTDTGVPAVATKASQVDNDSSVEGDNVKEALEALDLIPNTVMYVDASYTGTDSDGTINRPFALIQDAIAAVGFGAVLVAPGSYDEDVDPGGCLIKGISPDAADVEIQGDVGGTGSGYFENITCAGDAFGMDGDMVLRNCVIQCPFVSMAELLAENSRFEDAMDLSGNSTLNNCVVEVTGGVIAIAHTGGGYLRILNSQVLGQISGADDYLMVSEEGTLVIDNSRIMNDDDDGKSVSCDNGAAEPDINKLLNSTFKGDVDAGAAETNISNVVLYSAVTGTELIYQSIPAANVILAGGETLDPDTLPVFTETDKGAVPAPASAAGNFLRDDGTWAAPTDIDDKVKASATDPAAGYLDAKVKHSIAIDSEKLQLAGDAATPGNFKFYGTDGTGTRGWYSTPTPLIPQGAWNANSNDPNISGTTTVGYFWIVNEAGSTNLGGITSWEVNDWAVKTALGWAKIDNTDAIFVNDTVWNGSNWTDTTLACSRRTIELALKDHGVRYADRASALTDGDSGKPLTYYSSGGTKDYRVVSNLAAAHMPLSGTWNYTDDLTIQGADGKTLTLTANNTAAIQQGITLATIGIHANTTIRFTNRFDTVDHPSGAIMSRTAANGFIFNYTRVDADFAIQKLTAGDAYKYDAGLDTHAFGGNLGLGTSAPTHMLTLASGATGLAVYGTVDQITNYQRLAVTAASGLAVFDVQNAGSAGVMGYDLRIAGTTKLAVDNNQTVIYGGLLFSGDNARDIGRLSAAPYRPRNIYCSNAVQVGSPANTAIFATGSFTATSAGTVALIAKGFAAQTANLQEWRSSADAVLAGVDKDGWLHTPSSAPDSDYKVANKKYVDDQLSGENLWDRSGTTLVPHNAGDSLALTNLASMEAPTYGAELLTGGAWTSTDWTGDEVAGWTHTAGNTTPLSYSAPVTAGLIYRIEAILSGGYVAGQYVVYTIGGAYGGYLSGNVGTYYYAPKAVTTVGLTVTPTSAFVGTLKFSVKEVTAGTAALMSMKSSDSAVKFEARVTSALYNTFIGLSSGSYNIDGMNNTALGYAALQRNTTGVQNTAIGSSALASNASGSANIAIGYQALRDNNGNTNIAIGSGTMMTCSTGDSNIAVGGAALRNLTTGIGNTAVGYTAGRNTTTGQYNVALGYYTGYSNTSGEYNTAVGHRALYANSTGMRNVALGSYAGRYETTSDAFYVDNQDRGSAVLDKVGAILYGTFNAIPTSQTLRVNAALSVQPNITAGTAAIQVGVTTQTQADAGAYTFSSPYAFTVNYKSNQSGQFAAFYAVTAEGKQAGFQHFDVANALGRLCRFVTDPGVFLAISPAGTEMIRMDGFGVARVTSTSAWTQAGWTAAEVPLIVKGVAAQSANLQEWQTSTGTVLAQIAVGGATFNPGAADVDFTIQKLTAGDAYKYDAGLDTHTFGSDVSVNTVRIGLGGGSVATNTAVGVTALNATATGGWNTAVGSGVLAQCLAGHDNTAIGAVSMITNTVGNYNCAFGTSALKTNLDGSYNSAFGTSALQFNAGGNYNTAVGVNALYTNTTGSNNTAVGLNALYSNTTGPSNCAYGWNSLYLHSTGQYNVACGVSAMREHVSGDSNTAYGTSALRMNVTGERNVAIGMSAGRYETGSDAFYVDNQNRTNTAGDKAGALLYGTFNAAPASQTLTVNAGTVTLFSNAFTGVSTGAADNDRIATKGYVDDAVGAENLWDRSGTTLSPHTSGDSVNIATGAAYRINSANMLHLGAGSLTGNLIVGSGGANLSSGVYNTAVGLTALSGKSTGGYNVAVGYGAMSSGGAGGSNVAVGYTTLSACTGDNNVAVGMQAASNIAAGSSNTAVGMQALFTNSASNYNSAFGYQALYYTTGASNTGLGGGAGMNMSTGQYNTAVGSSAMRGSSTPANNTGGSNVAVGHQSLYGLTSGGSNTAVGPWALAAIDTQSNNVAIGDSAQVYMYGSDNIALGWQAMRGSATAANNTGTYNIAVGTTALASCTSGNSNIAVGRSSLGLVESGTTNVAVGGLSLYDSLGSGNVALGYQAGRRFNGSNSLFIDNQDRGAGNTISRALIYGVFDAAVLSQRITFNAGLTTLNGALAVTPIATIGTPASGIKLTAAAHTALTASTEFNAIHFNGAVTQQFATGALPTQRFMRIDAPTYAFAGASTITSAATLAISGNPIAGTNATITNSYALWVQSGTLRVDGNIIDTTGYIQAPVFAASSTHIRPGGTAGGLWLVDSSLTGAGALQIGQGSSAAINAGEVLVFRKSSDTTAPSYITKKARDSAGSAALISSGDVLASFQGSGYDGASYLAMAKIDFVSEGTVASTRVPTAMKFYTGTDAAPSVLTERLSISSTGAVAVKGPTLTVYRNSADQPAMSIRALASKPADNESWADGEFGYYNDGIDGPYVYFKIGASALGRIACETDW